MKQSDTVRASILAIACAVLTIVVVPMSRAAAHEGGPAMPVVEQLAPNNAVTYGDPRLVVTKEQTPWGERYYANYDVTSSPCDGRGAEQVQTYHRALDQWGIPVNRGYWSEEGYPWGAGDCTTGQSMHRKDWLRGWGPRPFHEIEYRGETSGRVFLRARDTDRCTQTTSTERVFDFASKSTGQRFGTESSISGDGRFVAFVSLTDLTPADTNGRWDVYLKDRVTGTTTLVSTDSAGRQGNGDSGQASLSADGLHLVFWSSADNLVAGDTNGLHDIFVKDLRTGSTTKVSNITGEKVIEAYDASISADGGRVAFSARIEINAWTSRTHAYVTDRTTGLTRKVSVSSTRQDAVYDASHPQISGDGRYVSFDSYASNLVVGDTNDRNDIFVHDVLTGITERVGEGMGGVQANGNSSDPAISHDGRYVAFSSGASNLVPNDTNSMWDNDVFVVDRVTRGTIRASVSSAGVQADRASYYPSMSSNGRYVAFTSSASTLVDGDLIGAGDVFVHDTVERTTTRVSLGTQGQDPNEGAGSPVISGDGRLVTFVSSSWNLICGDEGDMIDVFVASSRADVPAPHVIPILSGPAGQIDPDGEGAVKDGDLLTFSGAITEGAGGAPDRESAITTCDVVTSDSTGVEVKRITVPLSSCKNDNGTLTGSFRPADLGATDGTVALEVVATRSLTKSSGPRRSKNVRLDNWAPELESAVVGCQFFGSACSPTRTVRVGLDERVTGDFDVRDFAVTDNTVVAARLQCARPGYCAAVRLTLATDIVSVAGTTVSYKYVPAEGRVRPADTAGHHLRAGQRQLVDLDTTEGSTPPEPDPADTADAPVTLGATPAGHVLTLTVNAMQSCDKSECGDDTLAVNLARRVVALAQKPRDHSDGDGMKDGGEDGVAPDILLLQESRCEDAREIAQRLNARIKVRLTPGLPDAVANPFTYRCLSRFQYQKDVDGNQKKNTIDPIYRADTPIVYNTATVEPLTLANGQQDTGTAFISRYERSDRPDKCTGSGADDHPDACQMLFKRHLALGFTEKQGAASVQVAVTSVHLANGFHIHDHSDKDPDPEGLERYHAKAADWLTQPLPSADRGIADLLQERYGSAVDFLSIGGDLNVERCTDKHIEEKQGATCGTGAPGGGTHSWWSTLTAGYGYRDIVFAAHGTDEGMAKQYRNGCNGEANTDGTCTAYDIREHRIDFVFSKSTLLTQGAPVGSHDITCGQRVGQPVANCDKDGTSGDRYSDHRLVWGLVGLNA